MMRLTMTTLAVLLMVVGLGSAELTIIVMDASKHDDNMQTAVFEDHAIALCSKEFVTYTDNNESSNSRVQFWFYDRFKQKIYCVLSSNTTKRDQPVFAKTVTGTIILAPMSEHKFSADSSLKFGSVRFAFWLPKSLGNADTLQQEIQANLPEFQVAVLRAEFKPYAQINLFHIYIRDQQMISWNYPDFEMDALSKLEQLVQILCLRDAKIDEIHWPDVKVNSAVYLDTYYTVDRPAFYDRCAEFLKTLTEEASEMFRCKAVGEEISLTDPSKLVTKLVLYLAGEYRGSRDYIFATNVFTKYLKRRDGQCVYPVQFRPNVSFYEPSNFTEPQTGYTFNVMWNEDFPRETNEFDICTELGKRLAKPLARCSAYNDRVARYLSIVTQQEKDLVLNTMTKMMSQFQPRNSTCVFNLALPRISKIMSTA